MDKPWEAEQRLQGVKGVLGRGAGKDPRNNLELLVGILRYDIFRV